MDRHKNCPLNAYYFPTNFGQFGREDAVAGCIAFRLGHGMHQSRSEHVIRAAEDRNNFRRLLRNANSGIAGAHDQVDLLFDDFGSVGGKLFCAQSVAVRIG